jgi:hypothetical protein
MSTQSPEAITDDTAAVAVIVVIPEPNNVVATIIITIPICVCLSVIYDLYTILHKLWNIVLTSFVKLAGGII